MAIGKACEICGNTPAYNYKNTGNYYCLGHKDDMNKYGYIRERNARTPNEIVIYKNYVEIILYNKELKESARAIIDLEDVEKVRQLKWYEIRGYVNNKKLKTTLQNFIMNFIPDKKHVIDHINRNRLDCRKENLRIVSYFVNAYNKGIQSNNTSGVPGVRYNKNNRNWNTAIKVNKKTIWIGVYNTLEEAIIARKEAEIKYFGEEVNREYDCNTVFKKKKDK